LILLFAIGLFYLPVTNAEDVEFPEKNPAPIGPPETSRSKEWITKAGTQRVRMSLAGFFSTLTPENLIFDPKIIYDQYALARGTEINGEDGRWGTRFGVFVFSLCEGDFDNDGDVDGQNLSELVSGNKILGLDLFAVEFGQNDCL